VVGGSLDHGGEALRARTVVLCGGLDVAADGLRLHLSPPKRSQTGLAVGYLLLEGGRPVPADQLADAVWPKGPPASWSSGLRRVVSEVRSWLRSGGIDAEVRAAHGTYQLVLPDEVTSDVGVARRSLYAARAADIEEDATAGAEHAGRAAALLDGPLLPAYDAPWLELHRQDLERDLLEALDLLADAERRRGNPDLAVAVADRAIGRDRLRESSYRLAMAAHRQAGRVGAALRTYELCRRALEEELGTSPSPSTITAYHALLDLDVGRVPAAAPIGPLDAPDDALAAAASSMQRLESRQTIAALEARLATIDASPTPDPVRRVETLIELGQARWVVEGNTEALRRISLAAGEAALALGLPDSFGDALGLASTTTGIGQQDPDAADLCERGRLAFLDHPEVQVRILGLRAELAIGQDSIDLAQRAVDDARALGDEALLLDMLLVLDQSLAWTPDLAHRLAVAEECNELRRRVPRTFRRRPTFEAMTRLQAGDHAWLFDQEASAPSPSTAGRTGPWEVRTYVAAMYAVRAKLTGDLSLAHRLATELLQESAGELNSMHAAGGLLLAIAREQGGVEDLLPAIEGIVASNPRIAAFQAALALGRATTGDEAGARAVIDAQASVGFDVVPHDHVYLLYLGLLSEAVALLGAAEHVESLLELLAPYEGQMCVGAHGLVVLNAMDTYRGMLATVTGDPRGRTWFDAGLQLAGGLHAVLLRARAMAWKAAWLRRHGGPGDRAEADQLFATAQAVATAEPDRAGLLAMVEHLATTP
jgi:DNA-binding SARP family transcriptional activator